MELSFVRFGIVGFFFLLVIRSLFSVGCVETVIVCCFILLLLVIGCRVHWAQVLGASRIEAFQPFQAIDSVVDYGWADELVWVA